MTSMDPPMQNAAALMPGVPLATPFPDFQTYIRDIDQFRYLTNINNFEFEVKLSDIGSWPSKATPSRLAYRIYDYLETVLRDAGFYGTATMETEATEREVTVRYRDPEYTFSITSTPRDCSGSSRTGWH